MPMLVIPIITGFKIHVDEGDSEAYIEMYGDLIVEDNKWIGLGAAKGRIEFDNQATDEINFLDCNVGIGTSTPSTYADFNFRGWGTVSKRKSHPNSGYQLWSKSILKTD